MANLVCEVLLTEAPLKALPQTLSAQTGAIVDFWGVVRRLEDKREIDGIDYEAHRDMAEHQLRKIAQQAGEEFGLELVVIRHRIGFVAVGEASLLMRVCSPHREEAFRASRWIMNELKRKVPIWKKPKFKAMAVTGVVDAGEMPESSPPVTGAIRATV